MKKNDLFFQDFTRNPTIHLFCGDNSPLLNEKQKTAEQSVHTFIDSFPGESVYSLLRVPARINLMGVHIDHQGGYTNYVTLARETLLCFSPRDDDQIIIKNIDAMYPEYRFSMQDGYPPHLRGHWLSFIQKPLAYPGFWGNYIEAAAFRLQEEYPKLFLRGMNLLIGGNIPPNAGLSSSSTLVVGAMMALVQINQLAVTKEELIDLCGSAEWYVGTRGGSGDHAAMILGKYNTLLNAGFKPFRYSYYPIPDGIDILLIHSGIQSHKATNSKKIFNSRVAAYEVSRLLFLDKHPQYKESIHHLRDISPETLQIPLPDFYCLIKTIPEKIDKNQLLATFPGLTPEWERIFKTYQIEEEPLPLREVFLFGICEYQRARQFPLFLHSGQLEAAGQLMNISHDGDRVTTWEDNRQIPYQSPYENPYLDSMAEQSRKEPGNPRINLMFQPGGYRCSTPEIDEIVDYCKRFPDILGAGLTGAGLGGAIIALVPKEKSQAILNQISGFISRSRGTAAFCEICQPAAGASFILGGTDNCRA